MVSGGLGSFNLKGTSMGWWKKLKIWYKAGVFVGGIHALIYMMLIPLFGEAGLYIMVYLESPWAMVLEKLGLFGGVGISSTMDLIVLGAVGTLIYAIFTSIVSYGLTKISVDKSDGSRGRNG